ncbi:MAG: 5'-methylthioadenosine/S-adenosylhomocysteine nucleosidase [Clostridia bacterium]|nr:5'-methylthioadenosine/S-adenosylhomocysteine nucleosidase [Clostridia bacterium]
MIGFVVAMEKEAKLFLETANIKESLNIANKKIYVGSFCNQEFVLIIGGIGKVNAGMSTQLLIDKFQVDKIINFGTAGGKDPENQHVGDVALIDKVCQFDFDLSEIDDVNIGYMQDFDLTYFESNYKKYKGNKFILSTLGTGDRFTFKDWALNDQKELGATVIDMEGGAIAQVAYANGVEFYLIKVLTDVEGSGEESIFKQYYDNVKEVSDLIPNAVKELIENI